MVSDVHKQQRRRGRADQTKPPAVRLSIGQTDGQPRPEVGVTAREPGRTRPSGYHLSIGARGERNRAAGLPLTSRQSQLPKPSGSATGRRRRVLSQATDSVRACLGRRNLETSAEIA
jgi:hypothetical protein